VLNGRVAAVTRPLRGRYAAVEGHSVLNMCGGRGSKRQRLGLGGMEGGEQEWTLEPSDSAVVCGDEQTSRVEPRGEGDGCYQSRAGERSGWALVATSAPADNVAVQDSAVLLSSASVPLADRAEASDVQRAEAAASDAWPPPPVKGRVHVSGRHARSRYRLNASSSSDGAIDYARALRFIARVKSTCAPECFPAFLETLLAYQRGKLTVAQVYGQAAALFAEQGDLGEEVLRAFREFLPQGRVRQSASEFLPLENSLGKEGVHAD
jgi:hypothetical protein